jgi:putative ATP-dependent endonuclease of OLD family
MVEGDAENILIPVIADIIDLPLYKYGVSIVNVGSTAFSRYAKIFNRREGKPLEIPVAVVTDMDVRAMEYYDDKSNDSLGSPEYYYQVPEALYTEGGQIYDLASIKKNVYFNKDQFKDAIKQALGVNRMPTGVNNAIEKLPKSKIDTDNIADIRLARKLMLEARHKDPVKSFVNGFWTLEYDIALSVELRIHMAKAVLIANKITSSEAFWDSLYKDKASFSIPDDNVDESIDINSKAEDLCKTGDNYEIAYRIFEPFLNKSPPSKAVTAQILSEILKSFPGIKDTLIKDSKVEYLVNAIKYACGKESPGVANDAEL